MSLEIGTSPFTSVGRFISLLVVTLESVSSLLPVLPKICMALLRLPILVLGFETAKALLLQGATVILACRSVDKATEARSQLMALTHCPASAVSTRP